METTCIRAACWLLLLFTCVQTTMPYNDGVIKKRQTEVNSNLTKDFGTNPNNKDVDEEAFSLEFSGEDYNTLVNLLLDARNEFIKLQVNPNNPSNSRAAPLNETNLENATGTEEPDTSTDAPSDPLLKSDVTENIYFNPVTPDPGRANPLAQLETVRDRKAKALKLKQMIQQVSGQVAGGVDGTGVNAESPQGETILDDQKGETPEDALQTVTTCIPPPTYLPVAYPVPVDPASHLLYQPGYLTYPLQNGGYVYPQAPYSPAYDYPAPAPPPPQDRADDPLRASQGDANFTTGVCLSYFCSRTVCTAWECTSDPCTSGQCVAKKCVEWSCDTWSNSTLTKVDDVDWVVQPEETQYFDPLSGL